MNTHTPRKQQLSTLWIGGKLPFCATLCIKSFLNHGHSFQIFCYRPLKGIPEGTTIRNAAEILPEDKIFRHANGSLATFSDWFRFELLYREGGFWVDADLICLTGNIPEKRPLFVREDPDLISTGILAFPAHDEMIKNMADMNEEPAAPMPWDSEEELNRKKKLLTSTPDIIKRRSTVSWGYGGPFGFTKAIRHYGLFNQAEPENTAYAVHFTSWRNNFNGHLSLSSPVFQDSWCIHLWNEIMRREKFTPAEMNSNSIVAELMNKHQISLSDA